MYIVSCLDRSVSSHNPANSSICRAHRAAKLAKRSSDGSRSRRNAELAGTRPYCRHRIVNAGGFDISLCFWSWNSLEIMFKKGLYHKINTEPDAHHMREVISAGGSYGRVLLKAFGLSRYPSV